MSEKLDIRTETKTTTVKSHSIELSGAAIKRHLGIPNNARITVAVPGGGDWSNMDLDLDAGHTLDISWEERS
ncbi:hypothetical protein [Roseobacter phage RDJL6]|nr:hypothetical protein [Roseobacter phage RDJL6]